MGINRLEYGDRAVADISASTATAENLATGITAHDGAGNPIIGEMQPYENNISTYIDTTTRRSTASFGGIPRKPRVFAIRSNVNITCADVRAIAAVTYIDGRLQFESVDGDTAYSIEGGSWSWSDGTLQVNSTEDIGYFMGNCQYGLYICS